MDRDFWPGTRLRDAALIDAAALLQLERSIDDLHETQRWSLPRWLAEISKNYVWVIEQQGAGIVYAIGFVIDGEVCDVIKLISNSVGRTFTGRVISEGMGFVREQGARIIKGRCAKELIEFYQRQGFQVTGEMPNYFRVGVSAWSIERPVS